MEVVLLAGALIAAAVVYRNVKARRIVRRHAVTLAARTGRPADRIFREIIARRLTPGQWAAQHGLDPLTFQAVGTGDASRPHPEPGRVEEFWNRVRVADTAPLRTQRRSTGSTGSTGCTRSSRGG
jgi:hypothetical protein